jgi:DNA-binding transcriptional LysR family regulator
MALPKGLDLRSLNVFIEASRAKNMAEAAVRLGMTQPAVSQYISKLEDLVGASLLDRRLRPARLTPAGEVLRDLADSLLTSAEQALAAVRGVGDHPLPTLRLALPNSLAATLTPYLYDIVQAEMRPGHFAMRSGQAIDHVRALLEREVDVVIASETTDRLTGIESYPLFRERLILMVPADFDGDAGSISVLAEKLPLIRFAGYNVVGQLVERHLRRLRVNPPRNVEFDSAQMVAAVVARGAGFAIATPMCVLEGIAVGHNVRALPLAGPSVSRTLHLLVRGRELGPQATMLAALCRRVLTERIAPRVNDLMPWLGDGFDVIDVEKTKLNRRDK